MGLLPFAASASEALEGSWNIDWSLTFPDLLDRFEVRDGYYACLTCAPEIRIRADGKDHPIRGYPDFDSLAVQIKDDHQLRTEKKLAGKLVETVVMTVSNDGNLMRYNSYTGAGQGDVQGGDRIRLGQAVSGVHALTGTWITQGMSQPKADSGFSYHFTDGQLAVRMSNGEAYEAPLDGTRVPYRGSQEINQVSVRQLSDRVLNIQLFKNDAFVRQMQVTASEDGEAMSIYFVSYAMSGNLIARRSGTSQAR
ncbi:hypothetical protein JVX91_02240 [Pseudomonas sp. PDNC002]|uniref:hypothetical protein n=1 Tax=Pseudomonas sp. PDNC002 TaxID=2811422 RepID=UPI001963A6D8|nr:hypothetical protein [Pseudomonas sp. PDNC002]QRY79959.1 hypothetical protein JVX91_02240 [Pseudomonas sp. PDNC002]